MVCCGIWVHQEGGLRMTLGIRQYPHAVDLALTIVQKSVSKLPSGEDHRPDIDTSRPADAYAPSPRTPPPTFPPVSYPGLVLLCFLSERAATVPLCWRGTAQPLPRLANDLTCAQEGPKRQHYSKAISDDP